MFADNLIPNATYYIPLLKRMTALNGPIRVTLEAEHGEAVKVKAPDGYTARLGVMLEDYRVVVSMGTNDEDGKNRPQLPRRKRSRRFPR